MKKLYILNIPLQNPEGQLAPEHRNLAVLQGRRFSGSNFGGVFMPSDAQEAVSAFEEGFGRHLMSLESRWLGDPQMIAELATDEYRDLVARGLTNLEALRAVQGEQGFEVRVAVATGTLQRTLTGVESGESFLVFSRSPITELLGYAVQNELLDRGLWSIGVMEGFILTVQNDSISPEDAITKISAPS